MADPHLAAGAGWFADPRPGPDGSPVAGYRWWDGTQWTAWLSDRDDVAPPLVEAAPNPEADSVTESEIVADSKPVRVPVAVAATVAVLVFALLAVGATVTATDAETVRGPAVNPPPAPTTATVSYRSESRQIVLAELSMTMPGAPWKCDTEPRTIDPYVEQGLACSAIVHENYDGDDDSYANVVVGLVADALVGDDPQDTALEFQSRVRQRLFSQRTTVTNTTNPATPYGPTERVARLKSRLEYSTPKLPSRYDAVDTLVVRLRSGQSAVLFSNLADDAPERMRQALTTAHESVAVSS